MGTGLQHTNNNGLEKQSNLPALTKECLPQVYVEDATGEITIPANQVGTYIEYQSSLTIDKVMYEGQSLLEYKRANGIEEFQKAMMAILKLMANSLNITNTLSNFQIIDCAFTITDKYKNLKLEELIYIFKKAKTGSYSTFKKVEKGETIGKTYNRLDIEIICGWIDAYYGSEEYLKRIENDNTKHKQSRAAGLSKLYEGLTEEEKDNVVKNTQALLKRLSDQKYKRQDPGPVKKSGVGSRQKEKLIAAAIKAKADAEEVLKKYNIKDGKDKSNS